MLLRSRARRFINAPPSTSTPDSPHQGHPCALIHLLPTLTDDLLNRIMSHLDPDDLQDFTLSCWAARDMVYATHVTKLTFADPNSLQWPRRALMSQRYPAVSHITIAWQHVHGFSESCDSFTRQNNKDNMCGITHLVITLRDEHVSSNRAARKLSRLLGLFASLERLELIYDVGEYPAQSTVHLILCEQTAGGRLQQHQHLLDHGCGLDHILGTAACITQLRQVVLSPFTDESVQYDILCRALLRLSALRDLTLQDHQTHNAPPTSQQLSMLTRLEIEYDHFCEDQPLPLDLDLPALKELTVCCVSPFDLYLAVSFSSNMHSLARLSFNFIHLLLDSGLWGLTSLKHLSLRHCITDATTAALSSSLQGMTNLTCLHVFGFIKCLDPPHEHHVKASLHLGNALHLSELKLASYQNDAIQHIPTSLTSLGVFVMESHDIPDVDDDDVDGVGSFADPEEGLRETEPTKVVRLPLIWLRFTQLRCLTLAASCDWGQALPLLAQLTTLEHLQLRNRYSRCHLDASCLDSLTQLTYLKLDVGMNLAPPTWPLLSKSSRLQHLEMWHCGGWSPLPLPSSLVQLRVVSSFPIQLADHLSSCRLLKHLTVKSWFADTLGAISGINCLAPLTTLQHLSLHGPYGCIEGSTKDMDAIGKLTNLRHLLLGNTSSTSLHYLRPLNKLTVVKLGCKLHSQLTADLPKLQKSGLLRHLRDVELVYAS